MNYSAIPDAGSEQLIYELLQGSLGFVRRQAAETIGGLSESNERIVGALLMAQSADQDIHVQQAATEALQASPHKAILDGNPARIREVVESIRKEQQLAQAEVVLDAMRQFAKRREHVLKISLGAVALLVVAVLLAFINDSTIRAVSGLTYIVTFIASVELARKVWRCPVCDSPLATRSTQIDPFFCPEPLACPHCATRLR